jgi:hypothetical protein
MNFEEALRAELGAITAITNKIYPLNATEGTVAPYIIYVSSEGVLDRGLDGFYATREIECEINVIHTTYSKLKSLTKDVIALLLTFQNRVIGGTGGVYCKSIWYEKPVELYENEVNLYRSVFDIKIRI